MSALDQKSYKVLKDFRDCEKPIYDEKDEVILYLKKHGFIAGGRAWGAPHSDSLKITSEGRVELENYEREIKELDLKVDALVETRRANRKSKISLIIASVAAGAAVGGVIVSLVALLCP